MPVLVLDLDEREAAKLLALHDPLAGMAEANDEVLGRVARPGRDRERRRAGAARPDAGRARGRRRRRRRRNGGRTVAIPEAFQVVIECRDEAEQQAVFERMTGEGYACRLLTL